MLRCIMIAAGLVLGIGTATAAAPPKLPRRIVSVNLCADTLLLQLVPRQRIRSVSFLAANPAYSTVTERIGDIPLNHSGVEEVVGYHPDLVLASNLTTAFTVTALRRLGYRVAIVRAPNSLVDIYSIIRSAAVALGVPAAGERLLARIDAALIQAAPARVGKPPLALFYGANGYSVGTGTLQNDLLQLAGYRNLAVQLGLDGGGKIPLERLLAARPDVVILDDFESHKPSLAERQLRQPVLREGLANTRWVKVAPRYWMCANADVAALVRQLAALR